MRRLGYECFATTPPDTHCHRTPPRRISHLDWWANGQARAHRFRWRGRASSSRRHRFTRLRGTRRPRRPMLYPIGVLSPLEVGHCRFVTKAIVLAGSLPSYDGGIKEPPMRRWLVRILIFLLLGAVTTVTVARGSRIGLSSASTYRFPTPKRTRASLNSGRRISQTSSSAPKLGTSRSRYRRWAIANSASCLAERSMSWSPATNPVMLDKPFVPI